MDILNKITGQLMAEIDDVKGFFAGIGEDVKHEWQCLTSDGTPVAEPTDDVTGPVEPDAVAFPPLDTQTEPTLHAAAGDPRSDEEPAAPVTIPATGAL